MSLSVANFFVFRHKEQNEFLTRIKKLLWVVLGSLSHMSLQEGSCDNLWCPIPFYHGPNLANVVQVILTGCLDQTKVKY